MEILKELYEYANNRLNESVKDSETHDFLYWRGYKDALDRAMSRFEKDGRGEL